MIKTIIIFYGLMETGNEITINTNNFPTGFINIDIVFNDYLILSYLNFII